MGFVPPLGTGLVPSGYLMIGVAGFAIWLDIWTQFKILRLEVQSDRKTRHYFFFTTNNIGDPPGRRYMLATQFFNPGIFVAACSDALMCCCDCLLCLVAPFYVIHVKEIPNSFAFYRSFFRSVYIVLFVPLSFLFALIVSRFILCIFVCNVLVFFREDRLQNVH